jgi:hypothetical protein
LQNAIFHHVITLEIAYKKLKSCVYYDKSQIILRNKIVDYEKKYNYNAIDIKERFSKICDYINAPKPDNWNNKICKKCIESINVLHFPKKLAKDNLSDDAISINELPETVSISKLQSFIDIDVEGQLLGILWIIKIGSLLDKDLSLHAYGNRLKIPTMQKSNANVCESDEDTESKDYLPTFSPYLFSPYFLQYEHWRDKAIDKAKELIDHNQDAIILTMDFSRFYYNINISKKNSLEYYQRFTDKYGADPGIERLNTLIYEILQNYSLKHNPKYKKVFLPIGFFPSNIIANYCLKKFDAAIIKQWNPSYYGRYVDDIIIVDKITNNSPLYIDVNKPNINYSTIIQDVLCNDSDFCQSCHNRSKLSSGLFIFKGKKYRINPNLLNNKESLVKVQMEKFKVFYFKKTASAILLDKFKKTLYKNTSEFRYLPEEDAALIDESYDEIFDLNNTDSINKLHSVKGIGINKYSMSKFLGKMMRINGLINDQYEKKFDKDILKIFDSWNILDNYNTWDRIIQILALNNKFSTMEKYVKRIINSINHLDIKIDYKDETFAFKRDDDENTKELVQRTLFLNLESALAHGLALTFGPNVKHFIQAICSQKSPLSYQSLLESRKGYCYSRMCDKYSMISFIDFIIFTDQDSPSTKVDFSDDTTFNLTHINDFLSNVNKFSFDTKYYYYPYMITPQELSIVNLLKYIRITSTGSSDTITIPSNKINEDIYDKFEKLNFKNTDLSSKSVSVSLLPNPSTTRLNLNLYFTNIESSLNSKKNDFTIAIGNTILNEADFIKALTKKPVRTYQRYRNLIKLINEAIREKSDILILPESYLPLEWLPIVARTCAKNQLALITGIEHIIDINNNVFNFTATILPYTYNEFSFSSITYHLKVHYSPSELEKIKGYNLHPMQGNSYDLFYWKDLWFSVYCCFELVYWHVDF